jgi:hypothetical protein
VPKNRDNSESHKEMAYSSAQYIQQEGNYGSGVDSNNLSPRAKSNNIEKMNVMNFLKNQKPIPEVTPSQTEF